MVDGVRDETTARATDRSPAWPSLPVAAWQPTRDTLHLWTQIVGKVRLANTSLVNHWWNTTLYVTDRGLSTSLIPYRDGRGFSIEFDFSSHLLRFSVTDGTEQAIPLESRSVSVFYADVMSTLDDLGLTTRIWPMPVEIPGAVIPFPEDVEHATYDGEHAHRFWNVLLRLDRVFREFRARFVGKASPVHFFWGGFDLAVTRFSGRPAPRYPRAAPNCGPQVMEEAYSHEVSSAGYWPFSDGEGIVYSYAYPDPRASVSGRCARPARRTTKISASSFCPTSTFARHPTPMRSSWSSSRRPTKPRPSPPTGIGQASNAEPPVRRPTAARA